jgi:hypothetical protein
MKNNGERIAEMAQYDGIAASRLGWYMSIIGGITIICTAGSAFLSRPGSVLTIALTSSMFAYAILQAGLLVYHNIDEQESGSETENRSEVRWQRHNLSLNVAALVVFCGTITSLFVWELPNGSTLTGVSFSAGLLVTTGACWHQFKKLQQYCEISLYNAVKIAIWVYAAVCLSVLALNWLSLQFFAVSKI